MSPYFLVVEKTNVLRKLTEEVLKASACNVYAIDNFDGHEYLLDDLKPHRIVVGFEEIQKPHVVSHLGQYLGNQSKAKLCILQKPGSPSKDELSTLLIGEDFSSIPENQIKFMAPPFMPLGLAERILE